jgi:hypothetical protein
VARPGIAQQRRAALLAAVGAEPRCGSIKNVPSAARHAALVMSLGSIVGAEV